MCEVMQYYEKEAEKRGEARGLARGKIENLISNVRALLSATNWSVETIMEKLNVSAEERQAVLAAF